MIMKRFLISLVAGILCLYSIPVMASSVTPIQGLEILRRSFSGIKDFTADITQEKQLSLMKKKMTATGEVRFRKPDSFYMELFSPYASRILLKDNTLTLKLPNEEVRRKIVLPPEQGLGRWFVFLGRPVTSLPEGFDIRADKRGETIFLQILPKKKGAMKELQLFFREDGRLKKMVIEENNRDRTTITFHRMKMNSGLTEKDFRLE